MKFKRGIQRYGNTPAPVTPYQRAAQAWDDRIGSARVQARSWRLAALAALGVCGVMAAGLVWQAAQSRVVPYVVQVDRLGEAKGIAPAGRDYKPTDPQVAWHLGRFITNVRSISLDPVLMRQSWLSAYDFAVGGGSKFLDQYARAADPFSHVGTRTVSVQVTNVVRASDKSFQVSWTETAFEGGALVDESRWTGILAVELRPPRTVEEIRKNPLGIRVAGIDWSRDLDPAENPRTPGRAASYRPARLTAASTSVRGHNEE